MLEITELIMRDRQIAFLVTNDQLNITDICGLTGLFGFNRINLVVGAYLPDVVPELEGMEPVLKDILAGKCPRFELDWVNRTLLDGQTVYVNMVTLPHYNPTGKITGLVHIWQNVTDSGQINQELAQHRNEMRLLQNQLADRNETLLALNAELEHLSNLKSIFVSFAAHELGSPLTSILGHVDLLLEGVYGPLNDNQRQSLAVIERSISRLRMITGNLLTATKIESGHIDALLRPLDLIRLVNDVTLEMQPQIVAKSQRLAINAEPDLPRALCDATLAAQIIQNLISNASKYSQHYGEINVWVKGNLPDGFLQVSVSDNGMGIPLVEQSRLFERFTRLDSARQTDVSGTGLGLYITRSLVDLHGGHIWFESQEKKGSTFYVTFPVAGNEW